MRLFLLLNTFVSVFAFTPNVNVHHCSLASTRTSTTAVHAVTTKDVPAEGGRSLVEGPNGTIIVTKSGGTFYAVDAICPHLNLPMKKGKIDAGADGVPIITCNFHNSCFRMDSGKCTKWVTGALGVENGLLSGIMGNVGGKKSDVKAYKVTQNKDGSLTIA